MSESLFDRDEVCRQDVSRMAELGRFGEEFTFYGCVLWQEGRRRYCLSEQAEQLYACRRQWLLQGRLTSPVETYSKRLMIPAGMREGLKQGVRLEFAKLLQTQYPEAYFACLTPWVERAANNTAYPLLLVLQSTWSGEFDADHLQLYSNLTEEAFLRKRLTAQSYRELGHFVKHLWEQPGLFDAPRQPESRTFSAFLYEQRPGRLELEVGLPYYKVLIKKEQHDTEGQLTTPIFTKTCWFPDITSMREARRQFADEAQGYLGGEYWQLLQTLRDLTAVLEGSDLAEQAEKWQPTLPQASRQAIKWYGQLWG